MISLFYCMNINVLDTVFVQTDTEGKMFEFSHKFWLSFPGFVVDVADTTTELVVEKSESAATEPTIVPESPVSEEIGTKERDDKATSADRHVCNEKASKQKSPQSKVLFSLPHSHS